MLHRSRIGRSGILAAILLASAALTAARAAEPEILQQIPGDAYGTIVVSNVKVLANKLSNAATRLQVSVPTDLVGTMTSSVGITQGFDPNGSIALVFLKPGPDRAGQSYFANLPPVVLLVPATNPSLLLEKFGPTAPDKDGISQIALLGNPEDKGFVAVVAKKWVALAQTKEDLAAYLARGDALTKVVPAETLKAFEANDLVFWGNMEKLGTGADQWLENQKAAMIGKSDLTVFVENQDPITGLTEKAGIRMVFDLAERFLKDAGASMLTLRLSDTSATLGLVAAFKPESPMGKFLAAQPAKPDAVSLKGLPAGSFLVAGAGQWNAPAVTAALGDFLNQIAADPSLAKDPRLPELRRSIDDARQAAGLVSGVRFTLLEPPARAKDGYVSGAFLIDTSDPKKLIDLELKMAGSKLAQESMTPDVKTTVTVTPNALAVKDVPLTKMNFKYALREATPDKPISEESRQSFDTIQRLYGANGPTVYLGVVGKRVLVVYGTDLNMIESAIGAAQSDSDALAVAPDIAATNDQLVANPIGVAYLPVVRWVNLAQAVMFPGTEGQVAPAAANAPPVAVSVGISGKMMTAEINIPMTTIIATQDALTRFSAAGARGTPGGPVVPGLP